MLQLLWICKESILRTSFGKCLLSVEEAKNIGVIKNCPEDEEEYEFEAQEAVSKPLKDPKRSLKKLLKRLSCPKKSEKIAFKY